MDPVILSRIQFAANISFHILFPSITIALGWVLLFFKLRFNATKNEAWMANYFFFTKVFALSFAIGVVSGVTMSFQFGTNWPVFMETVGNIAGPLLAYEVLTAFFLEATFLGVMLFGFRRVPDWLHTTATALVSVGTTFSAFWILALNSWMQTPAGYEMIDGKAHVADWIDVIFNPSMPHRVTHMLLASGLTASFLIAGISAYRYLRGDQAESVKKGLRTGVIIAACLIPIQIYVGDDHGRNTLKYQPAKIAAIEGLWDTTKGAPIVLFGFPSEKERRNEFSLEIPKGASLILTHELDGEVKGLNDFKGLHPPVWPVFWSFRVMVGLAFLMLFVSWAATYQIWKRKFPSRTMLHILVGMTFAGSVATLAGWYVTEIGRQPWIAEGILRTAHAIGAVPPAMVASTLVGYLMIYIILIIAYISTLLYMCKKAGHGGNRDPEKNTPQGIERHVPIAGIHH